uniref:Uncharacterized protein n=1 Tax=viral metagenome TaxID=1070528 RepID=A0A6C0I5T9_9ZZZZ
MEDKNFTIIEDIFDNDNINDNNDNAKRDYSFLRSLDTTSLRPLYPSSNIPTLSYDEDMIKNKITRQMNSRIMNNDYNSLNSSNRILIPSITNQTNGNINGNQNLNIKSPQNVNRIISPPQMTCRNIYEHIENCPMCSKYYKQSNRTYILIIIFLVLIILLLLRQNN